MANATDVGVTCGGAYVQEGPPMDGPAAQPASRSPPRGSRSRLILRVSRSPPAIARALWHAWHGPSVTQERARGTEERRLVQRPRRHEPIPIPDVSVTAG